MYRHLVLIVFLLVGCGSSSSKIKVAKPENIIYTDKNFKMTKPFVEYGHDRGVSKLVFTKDGKHLLSSSGDKTVKLWQINNGKEIRTFSGHTGEVHSVALTNDGKFVLSASMDKTIMLWNLVTGEHVKTFKGHTLGVSSLAIDTNSNRFVTASYDGTLKLWDINKDKSIKTFKGHDGGYAYSVAFSPDSKLIVSGGRDQMVRLWDAKSAEEVYVFSGHKDGVYSVAFSPDGQNIASSSGSYEDIKEHVIKIWNIDDKKELKTLHGHKDWVYSVSYSPDGKYLASNSIDKTVKIWKMDDMTLYKTLQGHKFWTFYSAFSPTGKYLASADRQGIKLWDMKSWKNIKDFRKHFISPKKIIACPDKKNFAVLYEKNIISTYEINSGTRRDIFTVNSKEKIIDFRITNNKKYIVLKTKKKLLFLDFKSKKTLSSFDIDDKSIVIMDLFLDDKTFSLKTVKNKIMKIPDSLKLEEFIYSSDGRYIAYHKNENIILFDLKSNKEVKSIKYNNYIDFNVFTFSKDNKSLLISISEYQNYLKKDYYKLDIETSTKFIKITQNENKKLINNGKELLSIDGDYSYKVGRYSINLWDNKNNKNLLDIVAFDDNEWLSITSEGYFNSSAKAPKYLNVLTTPMDVSSIDQYFETFYRPDIMKLSLSDVKPSNFLAGQDKIVNTELKIVKKKVHKIKKVKKIIVIPTLKLSDVKPAPQVAIIDTKTSIKKEELKVTLRITPSSGGIGQIRLYLDGVLIKTDGDRGLKKKQNKNIVLKTYTIKLPKGKHTLKAIVYNEANTMASREDTLAVTSTYNPIVKPNIYAVIVGINEYKNPTIALKYAVADAKLFAKTIKKRTKGLYGDVNIKLLISKEQTSKEHITKTLKNLENISSNDLFIFFVASHGMIEDAKYHMITSNVGALSSRGIKREAIGQNALRDMIANIPTTKKFIILDTCNSGALGQAIEVALLTRGLTETTAMKVLSRAVGSTIISASSSSQEALEGYKGHGLLTYVLTDGLNGKADSDRDGYIKTLEIANFVEDMVPEIAEREFKRAQYPFISPLGQGFPLVKVK